MISLKTLKAFSVLFLAGAVYSADLDQVDQVNAEAVNKASATQAQIDRLSESTKAKLIEYQNTLKHVERVELYNQQLQRIIDTQNQELNGLESQLESLLSIEQAALPLLVQMHQMLGKFISTDLPFLPQERQQRLIRLQTQLDRPDVSLAEKYRLVLEAYQIEIDYGRSLEAYSGTLEFNHQTREVTFLRLGRLALYYQTADGNETGQWDNTTKQWQPLSDDYRLTVQKGIQMAWQQTIPELLALPIQSDGVALP